MKKERGLFLAAGILFGTILWTFQGCGQAPSLAPLPTVPTTPVGLPVTTSGLPTCPPNGQSCFVTIPGLFYGFSEMLPVLVDGGASASPAVEAGDTLFFSASGTWGRLSQSGFTCQAKYSFNGGGGDPNYDGAMYASDGTNYYKVGTQAKVFIKGTGPLSFGINVSSGTQGCIDLAYYDAYVRHCLDANGNAIQCQY